MKINKNWAILVLLLVGIGIWAIAGTLLAPAQAREIIETPGWSLPPVSPTPAFSVPPAWEHATLENIHFGEPQVVLTDSLGLRIVSWISENEVLIRRDTLPGGNGYAIEVFNVQTGAVERLAAEVFCGKPLWNPVQQAVVYLQYDKVRKQRNLMWRPLAAREGQQLVPSVTSPILLAAGGKGAVAYSVEERALTGKETGATDKDIQIAFETFAPPATTLFCGWKYDTAVSPDGKWQVVYNCEHFLLVNTKNGVVQELDLGKGKGQWQPYWALDVQWSPDGEQLAVVATVGWLPNQIRFLLLVEPWTAQVKELPIPRSFVLGDLAWDPKGCFLLAVGVVDTIPPGYGVLGTILVNTANEEIREVGLLPEGSLAGGDIAWSPNGNQVAFLCNRLELPYAAICVSNTKVGP